MVDELPANSEGEFKRKLFERIYSFKSIRKFSANCKKLQNEAILKVVGTFICNFTSIVLSQFPKTNFPNLKKTDSEIVSAKIVNFPSKKFLITSLGNFQVRKLD